MVFALAGNQNCGKTTLFNQLTGSNQHVGNFPGVTVERKDGIIRGHKDCHGGGPAGHLLAVPLHQRGDRHPGLFVQASTLTGIINIVDATNIERNLYSDACSLWSWTSPW